MNILESLTDAHALIRPVSVLMDDETYMHFWLGHVGLGVEDAALMAPQVASELDALIAANKVSIVHRRFVRAIGHQACFWQLNLDVATPITKEIMESLESYAKGVKIDLDKPLSEQDD